MVINKLKLCLVGTLFLFYPILIMLEMHVHIIATFMTFFMLVALFLEVFGKNFCGKTAVKYMIVFLIYFISRMQYITVADHDSHIKVILILFLVIDCCRGPEIYELAKKVMRKYKMFIYFELVLVLLLNCVTIFMDIGYSMDYAETWKIKAFCGLYVDPHQAAYRMCAMLVMVMILDMGGRHKTVNMLIMVGYTFLILKTGARVPTGLALLLDGIFIYYRFIDEQPSTADMIFSVIIIGGLVAAAAYIILPMTSFGQKIINSSASGSFDNGRSNLRALDMVMFSQSDWFHKIWGNGTDAVLDYHAKASWDGEARIWAHNDFMQALCGMGISMFTIMIWQWIKLFICFIKCHRKVLGFVFVSVCAAVAFFNGLYIHPRFVFIMPMMYIFFRDGHLARRNI